MMKDIGWLWILSVAAIFLYTFNLGELPLRDWDEGIVATVAREIYRADFKDYVWLYPQNIDGSPYWNKPPLVHGLIALNYCFVGINELTTRIISAVTSALCIPFIYLIGKEIFTEQKTAVLSAVVYLTLIPVARHGRLAMLDGVINFEFCLLIWCLLKLRSCIDRQPNKIIYQKLYLLGIGISFGLLCLTKGIALAFLMGSIALLFIILEYRSFFTLLTWENIIIFVLSLSPAFVWYLSQYLHYGQEFISYNLGTQTFNRAINAVENNSQPVWYYLLELIEYSLPWLIFLPGAIELTWRKKHKIWSRLTLIWFCGYLLVISLMNTKLPWYIMPIYPAFALLVGNKLQLIIELQNKRKFKKTVYQICFLLLSIIFWMAAIYYAFFNQPRDISLFSIALLLATTFTISTVLIARHSAYFILSLAVGLYITLLTFFNTPHAIWELAEAYPVKPVATLIRENTPAKTTVYTTYPYYRPSLNFYSNRLVIPISETQLKEKLSDSERVYLLVSEDSPQIPDSELIEAIAAWRIVLIDKINRSLIK